MSGKRVVLSECRDTMQSSAFVLQRTYLRLCITCCADSGPGNVSCHPKNDAKHRQYDATSRPPGPPQPGDMIFFGGSESSVEHVGIEIGDGLMIDAPHTGALVRINADGLSEAVGAGRVA